MSKKVNYSTGRQTTITSKPIVKAVVALDEGSTPVDTPEVVTPKVETNEAAADNNNEAVE